jgi:RNA polymerase sigma-70 factor (ECF subfamily)
VSLPATNLAPPLPAAFLAIVREHTPRVWRFLRYQGVPEADLQDGSQEVFLVVHRRLGEFRGDAQLTTWLYQICLHVGRARRRQRAARREELRSSPDAEASAGTVIAAFEARRVVTALLERLPEEQRAVVVLHEIEELTMPEVAKVVGCPVFTAYSRLRLAHQKMKKLLEDEGGAR